MNGDEESVQTQLNAQKIQVIEMALNEYKKETNERLFRLEWYSIIEMLSILVAVAVLIIQTVG